MKQEVKTNRRTVIYMLVAALLAGSLFVVFCAIASIAPFGENSILRNDGIHQYGPFLAEYISRIKNGSSLFFSWNLGTGTNEFGAICYYLLSPFNLIGLAFNNATIDVAMFAIILAKTMVIALTFSLFLQKKFSTSGITVSAFSLFYTFSGFYLAYYYNTMWLDALFMLPLIALGIENIVNGKKSTLYFIALLYTIIVNFYMAYMICIFAVLYFLMLLFSKKITTKETKSNDEDKIMPVLTKFGVSSLFAGLISAVVLIPVLYAISNSPNKNDFETTGFFFNVLDFLCYGFTGVDIGLLEMTTDTGPYIMSGMLTFLLAPMYMFIGKKQLNDKITHLIVLLILFFSFQVPVMNYFWHGTNVPAGMPYRFAFIFTFIVVIMAYETYLNIKNTPVWSFAIPVVLIGTAMIYASHSQFSLHFTTKTLIVSGVATAVYILLLLIAKYDLKHKNLAPVLLSACIVAEIGVGDYQSIKGMSNTYQDFYPDLAASSEINDYVKTNTDGLGRMEVSLNSDVATLPAMYGYNGVSTFSSLADTAYALVQYDLGNYGNLGNSYEYRLQTPIYNSLFSLEYIYDNMGIVPVNNPYFELAKVVNGKNLYKVKYALPIGYCVNNDVADWDPYNSLSTVVQYQMWNKLTGVSQVLSFATEDTISYENCNAVDFSTVSDYIAAANDETVTVEEHTHVHDDDCDCDECNVADAAVGEAEVTDYGSLTAQTLGGLLEAVGGLYPFKATTDAFGMTFHYTAQEAGEVYALVSSGCLQTMTVTLADGTVRELDVSERHICDIGYFEAGETYMLSVNNPDRPLSDFEEEYPITDSIQMSVVTLNHEKFMEGYNKIIENGTLDIEEFENSYIKGTVNAKEDSTMMMAMPYDLGWTLYIDGVKTEITEHRSHIMMFNMPAGEHTVEMKYVPQGLKEGAFVSTASILALALILLLNRLQKMKAGIVENDKETVSEKVGTDDGQNQTSPQDKEE